jgi:RHS repeat-associated protein
LHLERIRSRYTGKERDAESGNDYFGARYYASSMGRFMSPDPLLNSGRPDNPQTWNRYTYVLNNPLVEIDPTGLYNLPEGCSDDKKCAANAANLKAGLAALNKALDDGAIKDPAVAVRVSQGLAAMGAENDGNNVDVKFAPLSGTAAANTVANDPTGSGHYNITITFDPSKNKDSTAYAINADHEGIHAYDYTNYMQDPAHTMTPFQQEYRGYQNSSWSAQALGKSDLTMHTAHGDFQIWNSSWKAADQQTLRDRGITNVVTDKDHPETQPHNNNTP